MGVHVILDIDPRGIDEEQWEIAYDETVKLLSAWQPPLLGWEVRFVEGIQVPMYTNTVVGSDGGASHWCVVGDLETLRTAECQDMHRSLARYRERCCWLDGPAGHDIIVEAARAERDDTGGPVRVFGYKTQGHPYHFAALAAAMLIEERFPRHAMVWGDIDEGQAEEAARLAAPILGRQLTLPVRADAARLIERLRRGFEPTELPGAFQRMYLGDSTSHEDTLRAFPGEDGIMPWISALSSYKSPEVLGVVRLVIDWLNSGRRLSDACRLACLDPKGPRYAPEAFIETLALTWIAMPMSVREIIGQLRKPRGAAHSVASLFGSFFLDMQAIGRHLRIQMSRDQISWELLEAFGAGATELVHRLLEQSAAIEGSLAELFAGIAAMVEQAETSKLDDTELLATIENPADMGKSQDLNVRIATWHVTSAIAQIKSQPGVLDALTAPSKARRFIAQMLSKHGPTLTERAWHRILNEDRAEVLIWYMALVSFSSHELHQWQTRRAMLENQCLLRHAMELASDANQMRAIEELVAKVRSNAKRGGKAVKG